MITNLLKVTHLMNNIQVIYQLQVKNSIQTKSKDQGFHKQNIKGQEFKNNKKIFKI